RRGDAILRARSRDRPPAGPESFLSLCAAASVLLLDRAPEKYGRTLARRGLYVKRRAGQRGALAHAGEPEAIADLRIVSRVKTHSIVLDHEYDLSVAPREDDFGPRRLAPLA